MHGEEGYHKAIADTEKFFSNQSAPADSLSEQDLESIDGVARFDYSAAKIAGGIDIVTFLAETGIFSSDL